MQDEFDTASYVRLAAALQDFQLSAAEIARATAAFELVRRFAAPMLDQPVTPGDEPAPQFQP